MSAAASVGREIGRYRLFDEIASGGMATVHLGRLLGPAGFSRTVAIKRLHPQFAKDGEFRAMFLDEARLAARIRHPNVVSTLDVVALEGELFLVMEYVQGESLSQLQRTVTAARERIPPRIASKILIDALIGLHAAHKATSDQGEPRGIVHRDVSPQNILLGSDGVARVVDFGVAKAASRLQSTRDGQLKGKLAYMAPEQFQDRLADRRTDIFAAGTVLWECLTGHRLFAAGELGGSIAKVMSANVEPPSRRAPGLSNALDAVVLRALSKAPAERFATAREMAVALEAAMPPAGTLEVGEWIERVAGDALSKRAQRVQDVESVSSSLDVMTHASTHELLTSQPEPRSGLSSLSVARAVSRPPPRRLSPVLFGGIAGVILFAGLLVWFVGSRVSAEPTGSAPAAEPADSVAPTTEVHTAPSLVKPIASSTPAPSASAAPTATVKPKPIAKSAAAKPPAKPAAKPPSCNPPYYLDAKGAKRFKPECF